MIFRIYNSDFGIKIGGVDYRFEHVQDVTIEDPEMNRLTRGSNASNQIGLAYKEGISEPKRWTVNIMNMSAELKGVLDAAFKDQTRVDVYCIDRGDGSAKIGKDALLCNYPQQLTLDQSPESMAVQLTFETFASSEVHKV